MLPCTLGSPCCSDVCSPPLTTFYPSHPNGGFPSRGFILSPSSPAPPRCHTSYVKLSDPWYPVPPSAPAEHDSLGLGLADFHSSLSPHRHFSTVCEFPSGSNSGSFRAYCHPSKLKMGWAPTPALPPTACVTLAKGLFFSEPQKPSLKNGGAETPLITVGSLICLY